MLFKLLGAPITLPMAGMKFVFQQIADLADQELYDESVVRDQLLLLQVQLEEGDVDEDEFAEREAELLARLREVKARKRAPLESAGQEDVSAEPNVDARRRAPGRQRPPARARRGDRSAGFRHRVPRRRPRQAPATRAAVSARRAPGGRAQSRGMGGQPAPVERARR